MPRTRRRSILMLLLVVGGLASLFFWCSVSREPKFANKRLSEWCDQGNASGQSGDERSFQLASNAVWQIGDRAVPWVVKWATASAPKWEGFLDEKLGFSSESWNNWRSQREEGRSRDWARAVFLVEILGDRLAPAIPRLIEAAKSGDPDVFSSAMGAIQEIGPGGLPHLAFAITNSAPESRWVARQILEAWGPDVGEAGPMILPQLNPNEYSPEQAEILHTLAVIQYRTDYVAAEIVDRIRVHSDEPAHYAALYEALHAVGELGLTGFVEGLSSTNLVRRSAAIEALLYNARRPRRSSVPVQEPDRLLFSVHVDDFVRSVLTTGGSQAKTNCLLLIKDIFSRDLAVDSRIRKLRANSTMFLGELANDPDPSVAALARSLIAELGPLGRIQRDTRELIF